MFFGLLSCVARLRVQELSDNIEEEHARCTRYLTRRDLGGVDGNNRTTCVLATSSFSGNEHNFPTA
jgi:hypothetical protein